MKKVFIVLVILMVGGIGIFMKSNSKNYGKLLEVSYSSSGDSNGNVDKIILDINKKTVTSEYKAIHSDPLKVETYRVSSKDILNIVNIIDKNNIIEFSNLPIDTDMIAMDAPSRSLGLVYDNNGKMEWYSIDYNSKFPEGGFEVVKEVVNYLNVLVNDKNNLINSREVND